MRLQSLKHAAVAAKAIAGTDHLIVFGSSSLLATFPELGKSGEILESSFDADLLIESCDEELAMILDEAMGENRKFHERFGYCTHILRPAITELLPKRWRERLVPLPGCEGISCLDPHDLAVAKLQAGRPKDIALLAGLVSRAMLDHETIRARINETVLQEKMVILIFQRLAEILKTTGK